MSEMLVVSDTNIFIDLFSISLLDEFFRLPFTIMTTDFVINEITKSDQHDAIDKFIKSKQLIVKTFNANELSEILDLQNKCNTNASIPDCSVLYLAKKTSSLLLTGDAKLKSVCESDFVKVSGILFVMDKLLELTISDKHTMLDKLTQLMNINSRLPHGECNKRLASWKK